MNNFASKCYGATAGAAKPAAQCPTSKFTINGFVATQVKIPSET
jgi:hypothetical protein